MSQASPPQPQESVDQDASTDLPQSPGGVDHVETLSRLIELEATQRFRAFLDLLEPGDVPYTVSRLSEDQRTAMFTLLSQADADYTASLMEHFEDEAAANIIENLPAEMAVEIVEEMDSDDRTDVLSELDHAEAEAILEQMDPESAAELREQLQYEADTAGGLMITEVVTYEADQDVDQVIVDLRERMDDLDENDYESRYVYVVDQAWRLEGVVTMRTLLLARRGRPLRELMLHEPVTVSPDTPLEALEDLFDRYRFHAVPVVDGENVLLGVVKHVAVEEAIGERTEETLLKVSGIIGGEELRSMPMMPRLVGRLAFLIPVMLMGLLSATVIAFFEGTVAEIPIVAAFLPIVAGLSGSSGAQAVGVSIRELAMGLIKPSDYLWVLMKELRLGILNGLVLGAILFVIVYAWQGNIWLAGVIGVAFPFTSTTATVLGGTIPVLLNHMGMDAATASGPLTTTITDLCSFFIVLILATFMLAYIGTV